jgi:hypothetical protein
MDKTDPFLFDFLGDSLPEGGSAAGDSVSFSPLSEDNENDLSEFIFLR